MAELLTTREVAEELRLSTETILRWAREGDLPAITLRSGKSGSGEMNSTRGLLRARTKKEVT